MKTGTRDSNSENTVYMNRPQTQQTASVPRVHRIDTSSQEKSVRDIQLGTLPSHHIENGTNESVVKCPTDDSPHINSMHTTTKGLTQKRTTEGSNAKNHLSKTQIMIRRKVRKSGLSVISQVPKS